MLARPGGVHHPTPGVLTLTNTSEFGTLYSPAQLAALAALAHAHDYRVHVDGARFANAVAQLVATSELDPAAACRALSVDAGIDALLARRHQGRSRLRRGDPPVPAGLQCAAARAAERLPFLRKSTGHLLSKHRFVTGPFAHALADHAWLRHAVPQRHGPAPRRRPGLPRTAPQLPPRSPTPSSSSSRPPSTPRHLRARGHSYYPFNTPLGPRARLMCSFATTPA